MTPYFDYELAAIPTSLFKDHGMLKTAKARLAKALMGNVQPSERKSCSRWRRSYSKRMAKRATYREIAKSYVSYVHQHYGHS